MDCNGKVLRVTGDRAIVQIDQKACENCHACALGADGGGRRMEVEARNPLRARENDLVSLKISGRKLIGAFATTFMIPFAGFIVGFLLGYFPLSGLVQLDKTLLGILCAFLFTALSYWAVHQVGKKYEFQFEVDDILKPSPTSPPAGKDEVAKF